MNTIYIEVDQFTWGGSRLVDEPRVRNDQKSTVSAGSGRESASLPQ